MFYKNANFLYKVNNYVAQTFYCLKYANERSENYTNTERHVFDIIAKLLVDKFLFVIAKNELKISVIFSLPSLPLLLVMMWTGHYWSTFKLFFFSYTYIN